VSFVIFGVYLSLHYGYITSKAYSRLATQVKAVIWIVFTLVFAYEILAFADNFRWMGELLAITFSCRFSRSSSLTLFIGSVTLNRTQEDIILGTWVDFITSFVAGSVALIVQVFLTVRASVVSSFLSSSCRSLTESLLVTAHSTEMDAADVPNRHGNRNRSIVHWSDPDDCYLFHGTLDIGNVSFLLPVCISSDFELDVTVL